jgi:hypothetical protein
MFRAWSAPCASAADGNLAASRREDVKRDTRALQSDGSGENWVTFARAVRGNRAVGRSGNRPEKSAMRRLALTDLPTTRLPELPTTRPHRFAALYVRVDETKPPHDDGERLRRRVLMIAYAIP